MSNQASSTDTSGSTELKAGHAPATKVGGMRVSAPRPRRTSHGEDKNATGDTEGGQETSGDDAKDTKGGNTDASNEATGEDDENEEATRTVANRAAGQMVGGTFVPIQKAYPTEAVKNIHDKPGTHPKHEFRNHTKRDDQIFLSQPGKQ